MLHLLHLDESLFILINRTWQNEFFDAVLPYWRNKYFWLPFYAVLLFLIGSKLKKQRIRLVLFLGLSVIASDVTSSFLIKETVQRIRPCNDPVFQQRVFLRAPCGSGYSFTSSHAANHFSLAFFLFLILGKRLKIGRYLLLLWAVSIGFAQIYVGVHYPLDVLCGLLVGGFIAYFLYRIYLKLDNAYFLYAS